MPRSDQKILIVGTSGRVDELCRLLKRAGYYPHTAENAFIALTAAQECPPHLILLDTETADKPSPEWLSQWREKLSQPVSLLFTGETAAKKESFAQGADDFLAAPFEPAEVQARVNTYLALAQQQRPPQPSATTATTAANRPAEDSFEYIRRYLQTFLNYFPGPAWIKDSENKFIFANEAWQTAWELTQPHWYGRTNQELFEAKQAQQFTEADKITRERGSFHYEGKHKNEHGQNHYWLTRQFTLVDGLLGGISLDMTAYKLAEKNLRKLINYHETVIGKIAEGVCVADQDGMIEYINPAGAAILGYEVSHLIGRSLRESITNGNAEALDQAVERRIRGQTDRYEMTAMRPDGSTVDLLVSGTPQIEDGQTTGSIAVFRDITERKQNEAKISRLNEELEKRVQKRTHELTQASERLKLATRAAKMGIWDWDEQTKNLVWDDTVYHLFGIKRDDYKEPHEAWLESVHPDDLPKITQATQDALQGKREVNTEFRVVWPDGSIHYLRSMGSIINDGTRGNGNRILGVNWDVTARKEMEQALRHSEIWFRTIFESSVDAILVMSYTADGLLIQMLNQASLSMFGYEEANELIGRSPTTLFNSAILTQIDNHHLSIRDSQAPFHDETTGRKKKGQTFDLEISWFDFEIDEDSYLVGILRDITERKQVTEELKLFNEAMLEREGRVIELKEEVNRLAGTLGHTIPYPPIWETEEIDLG